MKVTAFTSANSWQMQRHSRNMFDFSISKHKNPTDDHQEELAVSHFEVNQLKVERIKSKDTMNVGSMHIENTYLWKPVILPSFVFMSCPVEEVWALLALLLPITQRGHTAHASQFFKMSSAPSSAELLHVGGERTTGENIRVQNGKARTKIPNKRITG